MSDKSVTVSILFPTRENFIVMLLSAQGAPEYKDKLRLQWCSLLVILERAFTASEA